MTIALVDDLYIAAKDLGCTPQWYDGILGPRWHCTCPDGEHGFDQQCSVLTKGSLAAEREYQKKLAGGQR